VTQDINQPTAGGVPHRLVSLAGAAAALLLAAPLALAGGHEAQSEFGQQQAAPQADQFQQQQPPAAEVDDATIDQFVGALVEVDTIQTEFIQEREQVTDAGQARELEERAQLDMVRAVEENGLSVADYNAIVEQMSADPALQQEISQRLAAVRDD